MVSDALWAPALPLLQVVLRVALLYLVLFVLLRFSGKREVGELAPMEFLAMLLLAETVSPALTAQDPSLTASAVAAATLLCLTTLIGLVTFRYRWAERLVEGRPDLLIRRGKVNRRVMARERLTEEELLRALRGEGVDSPANVDRAYVEPHGSITVIKRKKSRRRSGS